KVFNYEQAEEVAAFGQEIRDLFTGCENTADFLMLFQILVEYVAAYGAEVGELERALEESELGTDDGKSNDPNNIKATVTTTTTSLFTPEQTFLY
ncbi:unnamed protein product, partial [Amoebophrya sp. A25]